MVILDSGTLCNDIMAPYYYDLSMFSCMSLDQLKSYQTQ